MTKKKRRRNKIKFFTFLFVVAVIIFAVTKLSGELRPILRDNSMTLKKANTIEYTERKQENKKVNIDSFNEHIIKFEERKLSTYNQDGDKLWEKELDIDNPIIRGNQNNIVVVDSSDGEIYYIDYEGEIRAKNSIGNEVMDIKIYENGYLLVMLEKEICVFDPNGEIISNFIIPKGEVIDGDLSADNSMIALTILVVEEKKFYSNILFYSLEGKVLAGKKLDSKVIYKILLTNNNNLLVLGDNKIFKITDDDNILWEKDFEETLNRGVLSDRGLLVLNLVKEKNTIIDTKNRNTISQMDLDGNILNKTPVAGEVLGLDVLDDKIAAFTDRTIYIIDKKGDKILEKKINKDIKDVSWISKKNLLIINKNKLEIMEINY